MNTSGYETVLQLSSGLLRRIIDEERKRPDSAFRETFDEIPPTTIGDIEITETVVNIARGTVALHTLPFSNRIRLTFNAAEAQLAFRLPEAPSALLYEMIANIEITGPLISAVRDQLVQVGLATDGAEVVTQIVSGHPFDDDDFLVEAFVSRLHAAYASGAFPTGDTRSDQDFPGFTADLFIEIENDLGGDPSRQIRASLPAPDRIAVIFPIHLRFDDIQPGPDAPPMEPSMAVVSELVLTAPLTRQLTQGPAFVEADFTASAVTAQHTQAIEGQATYDQPAVQLVVSQTLVAIGQEIAGAVGEQLIAAPTLAEMNEHVAAMIQASVAANGQLISFWEQPQSPDFQDAEPRALDEAIAIAINAGPDADPNGLEPFLPEGQDFGILLGPDVFRESLDAFLYAPLPYSDLNTQTRVDGGGQDGSSLEVKDLPTSTGTVRAGLRLTISGVPGTFITAEDAQIQSHAATLVLTRALPEIPDDDAQVSFESALVGGDDQLGGDLVIRGLVNATGTIKERTQITIEDLPGLFTVTQDADIASHEATLHLDPPLTVSPAADAPVRFKYGFGLPDRCFDAGGWDREACIDDLSSSLHDGEVRLSGPLTVKRPHAVIFREIHGDLTIKLRLKWVDEVARSAQVQGGGQSGGALAVHDFDKAPDLIAADTRITIEGVAGRYRVTEDAPVTGGAASLKLSPGLASSPDAGARVDFLSGEQEVEPELVENPHPNLDAGPAGLLTGIAAAILTFLTQGIFAAVLAVAVIFTIKAVLQAVGGKKVAGQIEDTLSSTPMPESLDSISVGLDSRFTNPIIISPGGVLLVGEATPTSRFASLDDAQARAGGPYVASAGLALQLEGGLVAQETDYAWTAGHDLAILEGRTPAYVYPQRGYHLAELSTINHQFEGGEIVENRHLALVRVRNTLPELDAIPPVEGLEGEEIEVTARFSDRSWPDTHAAYVLFGDRTAPVIAELVETHAPPAAAGTITARHTYCDNGLYTITVKVIDIQGGSRTATTTATIHNVPPVVEAGPDRYAYACVPTRLVGCFTDQGWCDTHTATWDFGDCSPILPATVEETHRPPASVGTATATHCYERCGRFVAELTVVDDDGGVGKDHLFVRVVELQNPSFEDGFRQHEHGQVANGWQPYALDTSTALADRRDVFACERCVVHDGERAQAVQRRAGLAAGIYQQIGANPGWEYQVAAAVQIAAGSGGRVRLGVDPAGGGDPRAPGVVWSETTVVGRWVLLAGRAVADGEAVTIFLEALELGSPAAYFDAVRLQAYPCPQEGADRPPGGPPEIVEQCIDWRTSPLQPPLQSSVTIEGVTFTALDGQPLRAVQYGQPQGAPKLAIPEPEGLRVSWEDDAVEVEATTSGLDAPIEMIAFDAAGRPLGGEVRGGQPGLRILTVQEEGVRSVLIRGGLRGTLSRICIRRKGAPGCGRAGRPGRHQTVRSVDAVALVAPEAGLPPKM